MPYRVEIDIPGVGSGSVTWAMVGSVPAITTGSYHLYQTATTAYTWIMQPLDLYNLTVTSDLANNIEFNSSGSVSVLTIARWNNSSQNLEIYDNVNDFGFSAVRFGYPYRVEISLSANGNVTWP